jgi:hypothetical protein
MLLPFFYLDLNTKHPLPNFLEQSPYKVSMEGKRSHRKKRVL